MCGIVGYVGERNATEVILDGLKRLEYRGYDSAGLAVLDGDALLIRRSPGKIGNLEARLGIEPATGGIGLGHTRWATHGRPSEANSHPHADCTGGLVVVHNGIIENYATLKQRLLAEGHRFRSETDTEVIAHLLEERLRAGLDLREACRAMLAELRGAYAIAVLSSRHPDEMVAAKLGAGSVVVGLGRNETYLASDIPAILPYTREVVILEDGEVARITRAGLELLTLDGRRVERAPSRIDWDAAMAQKGGYRHFMLKEIHEQPRAIAQTLEERVAGGKLLEAAFGPLATEVFRRTEAVQIVACGTSYHAGAVAKYYIEQIARLPCWVEIASEYRYRNPVVPKNTLFVTISQSGETADTLAALRMAKQSGYLSSLSICNVPESSLVRESELVLLTRAGPEIGVASTKAFTTQLAALGMLVVALAKFNGTDAERERGLVQRLIEIPGLIEKTLHLDGQIRELAKRFADKHHALFLGRGQMHPIAMEGALKLKEISYIHAEAYPAGELKHGPLALVDSDMPVVTVAPNNDLLEKLKSNLQEVRARGGELYVFADPESGIQPSEGVTVITMPKHVSHFQASAVYTVPLQLLAYHCAILRGTDVDQPRNLAKSVTVE